MGDAQSTEEFRSILEARGICTHAHKEHTHTVWGGRANVQSPRRGANSTALRGLWHVAARERVGRGARECVSSRGAVAHRMAHAFEPPASAASSHPSDTFCHSAHIGSISSRDSLPSC